MATVVNTTDEPLDLTSGRLLAPGAQAVVDVMLEHEAALLADGDLLITDGATIPPLPANTLASVRALVPYVVNPAPFVLDVAMADGTKFIKDDGTLGRPTVDLAELGFDPATQTELDVRAAALQAETTAAISAHEVDTTAVHGIADTSKLAKFDAANAAGTVLSAVDGTPVSGVSTGVTAALIEFAGHSYAAGGGAVAPGGVTPAVELAYPELLASALHIARRRNIAQGGAITCWPNTNIAGDGGYAQVLQEVTRLAPGANEPFTAQAPIVVPHFGLNDLAVLGSTNLNPFKEAYRTILATYALAARYEETDASCAYTGTWAAATYTDKNSGTGTKYTQTVGDKVTISVPGAYDGTGRIDLFVVTANGGSQPTWGIKIDGVDQADWVMDATRTDVANSKASVICKRLGPLAAGAHTITLTYKSVAAQFAIFDSWGIEAGIQPVFVVPMANRCVDYSAWATYPHGPNAATDPMTDASIVALRTAQSAIHAEFASVIEVDVDSLLNKSATLFIADLTHLTNEGHRIVAEALRAAVVSAVSAAIPKATPVFKPFWRRLGTQSGAQFQNGWVHNGTTALLGFRKSEAGQVQLKGALKQPTLANMSTVMFTLPPGFRPADARIFNVVAGATYCSVLVDPTGVVYILSNAPGAANTGIFLDSITFPAEQ